jgi:hypothetical protein
LQLIAQGLVKTNIQTAEIIACPPLEASKFSQAGKLSNGSKKPVSVGTAGFSQDAKTTLISNENCDEKIKAEKIGSGAWSAADYHADTEGFKAHLEQLSKIGARQLDQPEATCHRNMLQRSKDKSVPVYDTGGQERNVQLRCRGHVFKDCSVHAERRVS